MKRTFRTAITLLLAFVMSLSVTFAAEDQTQASQTGSSAAAATTQTASVSTPAPKPGVFKKGSYYYYKNPKTGVLRKKAGFVRWNGNIYYVRKGGKITTSKTFKIGKHRYRAYRDGRIAVGIYKWGKEGKLYYSDPKNGRWAKIKSHRCQKGVKWKGCWYYLQTDSSVALNRPVVINNLPYYADAEGKCTRLEVVETNSEVVKVARRQIGKRTKSQVSRFWSWCRGRFVNTDVTPWCGTFVAWCYKQAGVYGKIRSVGNIAYVPRYSSFANRRGKWVKKSKARPGDIIVFGRNRHVGIVETVYKGYIYTIEGNSGPDAEIGTRKPGAVTRRVYKLNDKDIKGVLHP